MAVRISTKEVESILVWQDADAAQHSVGNSGGRIVDASVSWPK